MAQPYCWYYNPNKFFIDNFLSIIALILGPLDKIVSFSTSSKSDATLQYLKKQRETTANRWRLMAWFEDYRWNVKHSNKGGISNIWKVLPRNENIICEWGITTSTDDVHNNVHRQTSQVHYCDDSVVRVLFQCPTNLLPLSSRKDSDRISLETIPQKVPILFFFYGGAMVLKGSRSDAPKFARTLVESQVNYLKKRGIDMCVRYC